MSTGNGQPLGTISATTSAPLWFCYNPEERDALVGAGLTAATREDMDPDGRDVVILTGAGDLYGISKSIEDAQLFYGAGALSVRIVCIPTTRGFTLVDLLVNEVMSIQDLQFDAGKQEPVPDYNLEPWPELCLQTAPDPAPFPFQVFAPALQRYCKGVANVTLTPPDMAGCAMLAVASAAIGQSAQALLKRTWKESPLLFLLTVAEPGKTKSPVIKLVGAPLARIDATLRDESHDARCLWEAQKKALPKGEKAEDEPPQRRAIVKDITRETLAAILRDNPRGVLVDPDEATAWVSSFNEYKSKGSDRQFWLAIWASTSLSVDREGGRRSIYVRSPLATVHAGLPPDMLGALAEEHGRNDGFVDRILFSYPADFPEQRWTEDELDQGDETTWATIIRTLHAQQMFREESGEIRPHFIGFDTQAKAAYVEWFNAHCKEMESDDLPPAYVGLWSKLRAYCARFALILSRLRLAMDPECSELLSAPIRLEDVRGAICLVDYFKSHFQRVNHRMTAGTGSREARVVLAWIVRKQVSEFRERDVRQDLRRRFADPESLESVLALLTKAGAIRPKIEAENPHRKGPKPSQAYEVNPTLKERRELLKLLKKTPEQCTDGPF